MKKPIIGLLFGSFLMLSACSSTPEISDNTIVTETNFMDNVEYDVPDSWEKVVSDENLKYYYPEDGMLMVSFEEIGGDVLEVERQEEFLEGWFEEAEDAELLSQSETMINDNRAFTFQTSQIISGERYEIHTVLMNTSGGFVTFGMGSLLNSDKDYTNDFEEILNSIVISDSVVSDESEVADEEIDSPTPEISDNTIVTESSFMIGIEYEVPEDWTKEVSRENLKLYYSDYGMLRVHFTDDNIDIFDSEAREVFLEEYHSDSESYELLSESEITINGRGAYSFDLKQTHSGDEFESTLVLFNDSEGLFVFQMFIFVESDEDYSSNFEEILNSIVFSDSVVSDESETAYETVDDEFYFDGIDLITEDYMITITDHKIIQPGEDGNKYNDTPVIAFWYDITVSEDATDTEYNPTMPWMMSFEAVQDNNPNIVNKLSVSSHPDSAYVDTQLMTVKPGGTVTNAIAYKLTDLETPVTLTAIGNLFTNETLGNYDYPIQ